MFSTTMHAILITGGAGYIGSHIGFVFACQGYQVIVLDIFCHNQPFDHAWATVIRGDYGDTQLLQTIFTTYTIDAVIHCGAFIEVGLSVTDPLPFYANNVSKTITLLTIMRQHKINTIIFSSSCAVYGIPQSIPIAETHATNPISPYGHSKLMIEQILRDASKAYGLAFVALRYFNVAGALSSKGLGEHHTPETHIIPLIFSAAQNKRPFSIFGTNAPTPDGTCLRDYVHVLDIAKAHIKALQYLQSGNPSDYFNLGSGRGTSVLGLIRAIAAHTKTTITTHTLPPRAGDPPILIANIEKAHQKLGWQPEHSDLQTIISTATPDSFKNQKKRTLALAINQK